MRLTHLLTVSGSGMSSGPMHLRSHALTQLAHWCWDAQLEIHRACYHVYVVMVGFK